MADGEARGDGARRMGRALTLTREAYRRMGEAEERVTGTRDVPRGPSRLTYASGLTDLRRHVRYS